MSKMWKKGRGKLGFLQPLLGRWVANGASPMGPLTCTRVFEAVVGGAYIQLHARWQFGGRGAKVATLAPDSQLKGGKAYEEVAFIGVGDEGTVSFWSFTSDGKRSQGTIADVSDLHQDAIGFEAQMPAGFARMAYWPDGNEGFVFVVESKTKKGWNRFVEHHYRKAAA